MEMPERICKSSRRGVIGSAAAATATATAAATNDESDPVSADE